MNRKPIELCIRAIRTWMWIDKLKLNDDKIESMIIGSRQQLEKVSVAELSVTSAFLLIVLHEILEFCLIQI